SRPGTCHGSADQGKAGSRLPRQDCSSNGTAPAGQCPDSEVRQHLGHSRYELRNRKDTSKPMILVPLLNPKFANALAAIYDANFGFAALAYLISSGAACQRNTGFHRACAASAQFQRWCTIRMRVHRNADDDRALASQWHLVHGHQDAARRGTGNSPPARDRSGHTSASSAAPDCASSASSRIRLPCNRNAGATMAIAPTTCPSSSLMALATDDTPGSASSTASPKPLLAVRASSFIRASAVVIAFGPNS